MNASRIRPVGSLRSATFTPGRVIRNVIWDEHVKFRLSTVFLLVLTCAICLGWYVDRTSRNRRDILGTWYYPTNDLGVLGYTSLLEIRSDGTFTKIQGHRECSETFDGTYSVRENGRLMFHVTAKTSENDFDRLLDRKPETKKLDAHYSCRCAIDPTGYLAIDGHSSWPFNEEEIGIRWETCARETNYVIRGRKTPNTLTVARKNPK